MQTGNNDPEMMQKGDDNQIDSSSSNLNNMKADEQDPAKRSTDEESMQATTQQQPQFSQVFSLGTNVNATGNTETVDVSQLSNIDIIRKGLEYSESLQLEKAVQVYDEGIRRFPNDTVILDAYTDLLLQLDQQPKAKQLIERSIQLNPNKEGLKYLNYAEMLRGQESLQMYKKGIDVLQVDVQSYQIAKREDDITVAVRHIGSAYASIADLYMTDLW